MTEDDYRKAVAIFNAASSDYELSREAFRRGELSIEGLSAERKKFDQAGAEFDAAFEESQEREDRKQQ